MQRTHPAGTGICYPLVWASALRGTWVNMALPELGYKNMYLLLQVSGMQQPKPLDFSKVSLQIN